MTNISIDKRRHYVRIVNLVSQYLYDHLEEAVTLETVAKAVAVSPYHLNRIFKQHTGVHFGKYSQSLRLRTACRYLRQWDETNAVIDVALAVGFESHAAFSRAFKKAFGLSPSQYRKIDTDISAGAKTVREMKTINIPTSLNAQVIELQPIELVGLYGQGFHNQSFSGAARELFEILCKKIGLAQIDFSRHQPVGVSLDDPWTSEQAETRFFVGLLTLSPQKHPDLQRCYIDAGPWLKSTYQGSFTGLWQYFSKILRELPSPRNPDQRNSMTVQRYINNPQQVATEDIIVDTYIPLSGEIIYEDNY